MHSPRVVDHILIISPPFPHKQRDGDYRQSDLVGTFVPQGDHPETIPDKHDIRPGSIGKGARREIVRGHDCNLLGCHVHLAEICQRDFWPRSRRRRVIECTRVNRIPAPGSTSRRKAPGYWGRLEEEMGSGDPHREIVGGGLSREGRVRKFLANLSVVESWGRVVSDRRNFALYLYSWRQFGDGRRYCRLYLREVGVVTRAHERQ
jgi:hypothetical protein